MPGILTETGVKNISPRAGVTAPHLRPILSRKTKEPMRATS